MLTGTQADFDGASDSRRCYVCSEAEFLMDCGELLETIAPRIRTNLGTRFTEVSIMRHLRGCDRRDLIERDMRRRGCWLP